MSRRETPSPKRSELQGLTTGTPLAECRDVQPSKNILITGAGGPAAIAFARALEGAPLQIHFADADFRASGLYTVGWQQRTLVPMGREPHFVDRLFDACQRHDIDLLVPTVDAELLPIARERTRFESAGIRVLIPRQGALETCLDKLVLMEAAMRSIPVADFARFDESFQPEAFGFPFVVKPRRGSGSRGVRIVHDHADLAGVPRDGSYLVQAYLPGTEYSVDCFASRDGRQRHVRPRTRLKVDSGVAVCSVTATHPEIERRATRLLNALGLHGVVNLQFREDPAGHPQLLEINPRVPGTISLTVAAGANMPLMAVCDALGWDIPDAAPVLHPVAMVRTWQETFFDANDLMSPEVASDRCQEAS